MISTRALGARLFAPTALQCVTKPLALQAPAWVWDVWTDSMDYIAKFQGFRKLGGVESQDKVISGDVNVVTSDHDTPDSSNIFLLQAL